MIRLAAGRVRGLGLFGLSVLLNGVVSLITIPVLVAVAGADRWASMATGQSIGASFGVMVIFGWGLTGPVTIAVAQPGRRPGMFLDSLFARGVLLIPLLAVQAAVTFAIVPHAKLVAFLAGTAMTVAGASANWYFTGESRPDRFLLLDTVPRVSGTIVGVLACVATGDLLLFALGQLAGSLAALLLSSAVIFRGQALDVRAAARWSRIRRSLLDQRHGVVATGLLAAYVPAALAIIALFSPVLLPMFVLADRLGKFVAMAVSPLLQMLQGWVPAASGLERVRRMRLAGRVVTLTAIAGGVVYTVFLPSFSQLLTHGQVAFTVAAAIAFGINMTATIISPYLTNVGLMTYGRLRAIALSVAVSVVVTLLALLIVELVAPDQAVWALAGGNVFVTLWQWLVLRAALRGAERDAGAAAFDEAGGPRDEAGDEAGLTPALTPKSGVPITTADRSPAGAIPYL
ncbi:MAG TPA: hypothetical protein VL294_03680 [Pseudolysinimonas sp.]|nr:hypothetical protein [Pseudolysinimonas sp.]